MFGDRCARCFVKKDKVRLFDVIYEGKSDFLCERCAIIENISLIIKPNQGQIDESDKPPTVYDRMKKLSGISDEVISGEDLRLERLNELERNPSLMDPVKEKPDMVEHFNWTILRERRKKGLTQERLAEAVGIPVEYVDLLEKGNIPNNIKILEKLEDFFKVKLMKQSPFRDETIVHPVLLDEYGNVLDYIPEPDVEIMFSADEYTNDLIKKEDSEDFDIHKADLAKVSLKDLMELHRKKILVAEEEQIGLNKFEESQRADISNPVTSPSVVTKKVSGIDRNRLAEARKEELRLLKEKQSQELDSLLGGSELLGGKEDKENKVDKLFDEAFG